MGACSRSFLVVTFSVLALVANAFAQQRGSISGRITDAGDLAVPGATVTVVEQNTGFIAR